MMDVDGAPVAGARHRRGEASGGAESVVAGAKRKRPCSGSGDPGSTSHGEVDMRERQKRRVLPWMRHSASFSGRFLAAPREPAPPPQPEDRARTVALAMARVRRRIGKPTRRRCQVVLDQNFSRFSLQ